jgi:hypothetical protein
MTSSATSPPVLPVSNNPKSALISSSSATVPSAAGESQPLIATPAFRAFINNITESFRHGLSQRRPWSELADSSAFTKPESFSDAAVRVRKNYSYFRVNYLTVVTAVLAVSLLTNPLSLLFLVGLLASWLFLYLFRPSDQPLVVFGRTYTDRETLGVLIVLSVVVVFLTSVGSVLISALMVGLAAVCAHAAFRVPEDLFLDEQPASSVASSATGFLNFLGGAATNAAAAAAVRV